MNPSNITDPALPPSSGPSASTSRMDRGVIAAAILLTLGAGVVLWLRNGVQVFGEMLAGAWALCF